MASTLSLGAQSKTSTSQAQIFYDAFNKSLRDVRQRIEAAKEEADLHPIFEDISNLRTELTEKTELLPSYDRQTHEQHLKEVNELLAERRTQLVPKAKFSFQRKPKGTSSKASPTISSIPTTKPTEEQVPLSQPSSTQFLSVRDKQGQTILADSLERSEHNKATDLHILNLKDCYVDLRNLGKRPPFLALQLRNLQRCVILCGEVNGSTMIHDCEESLIALECKQFRMHSSRSMAIVISTNSVATIEHCRKVIFASPIVTQPLPNVQDFDHISTLQQSTNWSVMPETMQVIVREAIDGSARDSSSLLRIAGLDVSQSLS